MKIPKQQTVGWIKISSQVSSLSRILIFYRLSKYALDLSCIIISFCLLTWHPYRHEAAY